MANAPKKPSMLDEIIAEIGKAIKQPAAAAEPVTRPIAPPKGLANSLEERNKAMKEAENAAKGNGYKKGGMVKKTGKALVHKGEAVITTKSVKKIKKMIGRVR